MRSDQKVFFMSDAHFGTNFDQIEEMKRNKVRSFFDHLSREAASLYIVGDYFDFWFEYKHVIPQVNFQGLFLLNQLVENGVDIFYLKGNHDWPGNFLNTQLKVNVISSPYVLPIGKKRIYLEHGDGRTKNETSYKILRSILKNRFNIWLYRWLHPDIGVPMAMRFSHKSRQKEPSQDATVLSEYLTSFLQQKFDENINVVILGHDHTPLEKDFGENQKYINLGDWMTHFSYAVWENDTIRLKYWES